MSIQILPALCKCSHLLIAIPSCSSPCVCPTAGDKFFIRWYRGYLISVAYGGRGSGARAAALAAQGGARESMTLSIYDIQNQFVGE